MNERINTLLIEVFKYGVLVVTLLTIFLFWNYTTEFYETPKFLVLSAFIAILLVLSALKYITQGKVVLRLTPLDLPFLALLAVLLISTYFSSSQYVSLFGNMPRIHGSLISMIAYVLFYLVIVSNIKGIREVKHLVSVMMVAGIALSILTLLSYFGIHILPLAWTHSLNFTPTGPSFSTTAFLTLLLPFALLSALGSKDPTLRLVNSAVLTLFGVTIALTGITTIFIAAALTVTIVVLVDKSYRSPRNLPYLVIPALIVGLITILSFAPLPGAKNPLYAQAQNFPREVQLSFPTSWKVAISAFRDSPFWGTGPSTTLFNFTVYKPIEFNSSQFWNIRFDQLFNEYLGILSTAGGLGMVAFLLLTLQYLRAAVPIVRNSSSGEDADERFTSALALSGIVFFLILALHAATLVFWVIGIIILAGFFASKKELTRQIQIKLGSTKQTSDGVTSLDAFPAILLLIILGLIGVASFYIGRFAIADYRHRNALTAVAANNGIGAYNELVAAEQLNPNNDLYRTNLSQTNFALANAIASAKGPTQSSPSGSLTDADRQNIQQLLQQAINEGRAATTLSPRNAGNFEILGSVYRQISGVAQNSLQFALDSYGRAIQLDPLNPNLRLTVGGIYYSIKNYDLAIRFFTDAVNLKSDFANGYYNLSIAFRDKGDLQNAQAVAEQLVSILDTKSPDYKTASEYLADLKARIATGSAKESDITPPAAAQTSPLQQTEQRQVLDLPAPENIATPPAVKK